MAKWTKEMIKEKIAANNVWLARGVVAIWNKQTEDERYSGQTTHDNGIGFNGADAEILSSFAMQYVSKGYLSPKQFDIARKKMLKYSGQLAKIANKEI